MAKQRFARTRRFRLFVLGGLLGAAVFLLIYGVTPLDVTNDSFLRGGFLEKDIQQHYAGWLFYRESSISFPLCMASNINYPAGLSVAYTDSLPLFAALFRLLDPLLPDTFQYFGLYTLLCFVFQGSFGALLLGLFSDSDAAAVVGDILFVISPVLLERAFRHTSLGAQFLVLAALYYYFRALREDRYAYPVLFCLNALSIAVHPYFIPMVYAVTLATLGQYALRHRRLGGPTLFLTADLGCTLAVGGIFGYFTGSATSGGQALYGYFGMNLNSLWNPVGVNGTDWSLFLPAQNQVNGNYDAFAYLGLGVLAALAVVGVALLRRPKRLTALCKRHWLLCIVCTILSVFAVSNVVTANGTTLVTIPLPAALIQLCSVFRSGGRLFWPVYYLFYLCAFAGLCRLGTRKRQLLLVGAMAVLQAVDLSPGLLQRHEEMRTAQTQEAFPGEMGSTFWQEAAGRYEHIASMDGLQADALHLALYAADCHMTTNDPFAARYDADALAQQQQQLTDELKSGALREDTLYLFRDEGEFLQLVEYVHGNAWCGHVYGTDGTGGWYVIAPGMDGFTGDDLCVPYDDAYPLRLADYTDALWNRGVLDETKETVCFKDSPFARRKLENAAFLTVDGVSYAVLEVDDHDAGWLMVTLDIRS
ncbi:MAG: DUF6311 domain-containing protein, partial [Gemmiger sp.]